MILCNNKNVTISKSKWQSIKITLTFYRMETKKCVRSLRLYVSCWSSNNIHLKKRESNWRIHHFYHELNIFDCQSVIDVNRLSFFFICSPEQSKYNWQLWFRNCSFGWNVCHKCEWRRKRKFIECKEVNIVYLFDISTTAISRSFRFFSFAICHLHNAIY